MTEGAGLDIAWLVEPRVFWANLGDISKLDWRKVSDV